MICNDGLTLPVSPLFAGRCASCDHEALGSLRVMSQCGVMGQAAGVAAVLAMRSGQPPRHIDRRQLQDQLHAQGCILSEDDIAGANLQSRPLAD